MKLSANIFLIILELFALSALAQSTPNCTSVSAYDQYQMPLTPDQIISINHDRETHFPHVAVLEGPTSSYNCHNYAWLKSTGGSTFWLNSPGDDSFWTDGSYISTPYSSGTPDIRISYQGDHSAVTTSGSNQAISKWGAWGLYQHQITYVPAGYLPGNPLTYYRRNTPVIAGNDVCGGVTFSVPNTPPGNSVTWSSSNTSGLSINSTSGVAARVGSFDGYVTLTASFSGSCPHGSAIKQVKVGSPSLIKTINGVSAGTTPVSAGNLYNLSASSNTIGSTTFSYNNYSGSGNMAISLYSPSSANTQMYVYSSSTTGSRHVRVNATNSCGSHYEDFVFYLVGGSFMSVYPNPVQNEITIEAQSAETILESVVLVSEQTGKIAKAASIKDLKKDNRLQSDKILLNVADLPRGTYYLQLNTKEQPNQPRERIRLLLQ
jgi:hypothetical protein